MDRSNFRGDIQALRGIAVLLVLVFHAGLGGLDAGFLGVDIFFVLSGYLITGLVVRQLSRGDFSFARFYVNRAKRLLPAAYVVYGSLTLAAPWFLSSEEFDTFLRTLWGALSFSSNIVLWQSTNYFAAGAKYNALLHTWSLSLEEQLYFFLPLGLFLCPARWRLLAMGGAGVMSLALLAFLHESSVAAFYLLPTRVWEFAIGGTLALHQAKKNALPRTGHDRIMCPRVLYWAGILAVALLIVIPAFAPGMAMGWTHPGIDALALCCATGFLLVNRAPILESRLVAKTLGRVGDISYSLYLVHWPLFAFATNSYLGETPPPMVRAGLLLLSFLLAAALFRFVEYPLWRRPVNIPYLRAAVVAFIATLVVAGLALALRQARLPAEQSFPDISPNYGLSEQCDFLDTFEPISACRTSAEPSLLLWGDSFAMHLAEGMADRARGGLIQATKSACAPVSGMAPYGTTSGFNQNFARECISFNHSVVGYLASHENITEVIISSTFKPLVEDEVSMMVAGGAGHTRQDFDKSAIQRKFIATVSMIIAMGRSVTILGPPPSTGYDIGQCYERTAIGAVTLLETGGCTLDAREARAYHAEQRAFLEEVAARTGATFVDLGKLMCNDFRCVTEKNGVPLYRDAGHLTTAGSHYVIESIDFEKDPEPN